MEGVTRRMKEVKSAKRSVDTAIRMFGPANITSILDRDIFVDKLGLKILSPVRLVLHSLYFLFFYLAFHWVSLFFKCLRSSSC